VRFDELALPEFAHPSIEDKRGSPPGSSPGYSVRSNGIEVPSSPSPVMRGTPPHSSLPRSSPMRGYPPGNGVPVGRTLATPPSSGPVGNRQRFVRAQTPQNGEVRNREAFVQAQTPQAGLKESSPLATVVVRADEGEGDERDLNLDGSGAHGVDGEEGSRLES
jgi:hypothetical protein